MFLKKISLKLKLMFICSLIPIFFFLIMVYGGGYAVSAYIPWPVLILLITAFPKILISQFSDGEIVTIFYPSTTESVFLMLISYAIMYASLGFLSGFIYEKSSKYNKTLAIILALLPWLLCLPVIFGFILGFIFNMV